MTKSLYYTISQGQTAVMLSQQGVELENCKFPIFYFHGHGGQSTDALAGAMVDQNAWIRNLVESGYVLVSIDAAGSAWAGPSAMEAIDAAFATLNRSKIGILGYSMGGMTSLNWIKRNPDKILGAYLSEPATNLDWAYSDPYGAGWTAEIDAAYGSFANSAGYRVHDEPESFRGIAPIRILHTTDDEVVPYQQTVDFVNSVADPLVTLRQPDVVGGHTHQWSAISGNELASFFDGL